MDPAAPSDLQDRINEVVAKVRDVQREKRRMENELDRILRGKVDEIEKERERLKKANGDTAEATELFQKREAELRQELEAAKRENDEWNKEINEREKKLMEELARLRGEMDAQGLQIA